MKDKKFGSFEDLIELAEEGLRPIVRKLRVVIMEIDPSACEVIRIGEEAATYGLGPKKMSEGYCYIMPHKSWVNLGFFQGAHLTDPETILEGTGKNLRHVKIRSIEQADDPAVRALIDAALVERRNALST